MKVLAISAVLVINNSVPPSNCKNIWGLILEKSLTSVSNVNDHINRGHILLVMWDYIQENVLMNVPFVRKLLLVSMISLFMKGYTQVKNHIDVMNVSSHSRITVLWKDTPLYTLGSNVIFALCAKRPSHGEQIYTTILGLILVKSLMCAVFVTEHLLWKVSFWNTPGEYTTGLPNYKSL